MRVVEPAGLLNRARPLHSRAHLYRRRPVAVVAQFPVRYGRHLDVQIDAIEQRAAELAEIPLDDAAGTSAFPRAVAIESAWAPVQISTATEYEK
jgi:hypothetical protein